LHINSYTRISSLFAKRNEITLENQIDNPLSPKSRRERVFFI